MVYPIEELGQINIHRIAASRFDDLLYLFDRLLPIAARAEPETAVREPWIEDGSQHLGNGLLDHSVSDGWDTQLAFSTVGFIDLNAPNRGRSVVTGFQIIFNRFPVAGFNPSRELINGHAIDASRSLVGSNLLPGPLKIRRIEDLFE